ncbi:L,D-transpeptidase family protein [Affinibrenneria salicis]|uniref:L,D-transpeptidase family protein n=1 Tax=Affinibrenneria salicis TaxID=2590031 RepID=A0A5J5G2W9_9GAMM|nr:L,D-transpeptidase family protein [Affinibrenneria salicis]KAA9001245.1 L,D-transpeptidase family protein [Affinibrenneria salicis]
MKRILILVGVMAAACLLGNAPARATEYPLPPAGSRLIGENQTYVVPHDGHALEDIAARFKIGMLAMLQANPGTDPYLPTPGSTLTIPAQMLLPDAPRQGIVINLAELRLYYYPKGKNSVIVYPIGIGQLGRNTPVMTTSISEKRANPTWTPTANIRRIYKEEQGITLPAVVPAGPDNPMGLFALRLSAGQGQYLIHGTNANFGIGMRVSSGCIRLRPDDIEALFNSVPVGTRVQIVNEPVKIAIEPDGKRYIEVHQPLSRTGEDDPQTMPLHVGAKLQKLINDSETDASEAAHALKRRAGMPVLINVGEEGDGLPLQTPESPVSLPQPAAAPISTVGSAQAAETANLPGQ